MFEMGSNSLSVMQAVECQCGSINYQPHSADVLFGESDKEIGVRFCTICEHCNQVVCYEMSCSKGNLYTSKFIENVEMKMETEFCIRCNQHTQHTVQNKTMRNGDVYRKGHCVECGQNRALPIDKPLEEYVIYFGKHKGKKLVDLPLDYIEWCLKTIDLNYSMKERLKKVLEIKAVPK